MSARPDEAINLRNASEAEPPNHPLLVRVTDWLARVILGEEAGRMLTRLGSSADVGLEGCRLRVGQVWLWREPRIPVGRKGRAGGGLAYRLPVRVTWDRGHLTLDDAKTPRARWRARGMGWDLSGVWPDRRRARDCAFGQADPFPSAAESPVVVTLEADLRGSLAAMVEDGRAARWEFLLWLQPTVSSALVRAHASIRAEVGGAGSGDLAPPLVDQVKLDQLRDLMLFGDAERSSAAERLLALCAAPDTFRRVDPLRYLTTAIRRDAATELRRALGDPHVGRKVRSLARELGTTDLDTVVAEYRRRWPADHLAGDRAAQALSVGADPMAHWVRVEW
jgi:hypothetical protein